MNDIREIVIIYRRYCEGTANMNRLLAYAKGFAQNGYKVRFYFLITQSDLLKVAYTIPNVDFYYLWENNSDLVRKNKLISYVVNLLQIKQYIKPSDLVFLYTPSVELLWALFPLKKMDIFCEYTEHPDAYSKGIIHYIKKIITLHLLHKIKGLIVISQNLKNYYIGNGFSENAIHVSNMFVDPTRFENLHNNSIDELPYFAYCGTISLHKDGVDLLLKSFSLFSKKIEGYNLKIIGPFQNLQTKEKLYSLCEQYNITNKVQFIGKIPAAEMPNILSNAKVLLLNRPNNLQAQNGFPTKLGEYLATGKPILVTNVGEIGLFIKNGINGYLSKPDNPIEFANKLIEIIENYNDAIIVGNQGRQLIENEFSANVQSKRVIEFMKINSSNK